MDEVDEITQEFVVESYENLDQLDRDLVELEQQPGSRELLASIFRTIHTIKGTSGFLGFNRLESVTHVGENLLAKLRDGRMTMTPGTTDVLLTMVDTVRALLGHIEQTGLEGDVPVDGVVAQIQAVLDGETPAAIATDAEPPATATPQPVPEPSPEPSPATTPLPLQRTPSKVAEPVAAPAPATTPAPASPSPAAETTGTQKRSASEASIRVDVDLLDSLMRQVGELVLTRNQILQLTTNRAQDVALQRVSQRLSLIATELQEGVMKTRMQPVDHVWSKFPRVVRDLGAQCGKQVNLEMVGRETELDRTLLEAVKDPLTHLVRNAVDHGIESPADRLAKGKTAVGTLTLRAYHEGGQVVVEVADDGGGIDPARIADKAVDKGLRTRAQVEAMQTSEVLQLIFLPGFSTAAAVTNVSGRGVGMDVVKTNVEAIGGTIEIESEVNAGSVCRLRIPLTLAIVPALTVECAGDRYAIPQVALRELVNVDQTSGGIEYVAGAPVYRLRGQLLPLIRLADVLKVPAKRSDSEPLIAVLSTEGRPFGLIIDEVLSTEEIVVKPLSAALKSIGVYSGATILGDGTVALILDVQALSRRELTGELTERLREDEVDSGVEADSVSQVLVAGIGSERRVAIPLDTVTRLERVPAHTLERVGNREVVQYRGAILPLLRLDRHLGTMTDPHEEILMVVYTENQRSVAIVVDEIIDIVDAATALTSDIDDFGLLGSTVIKERITELLDVRSAILAADPAFYHRPTTGPNTLEGARG